MTLADKDADNADNAVLRVHAGTSNMDVETQFIAYKCLRFCGLMMAASSALTWFPDEAETAEKKRVKEAQRHLAAGIAAVQRILPKLEAYAQATIVQKPVQDSRGEGAPTGVPPPRALS